MRERGIIVPVSKRLCITPVYSYISKHMETKDVPGLLDDLDNPKHPFRRVVEKTHDNIKVKGGILPGGQLIHDFISSRQGVSYAIRLEGFIHKVENVTGKRLPHIQQIAAAATAFGLATVLFGAEERDHSKNWVGETNKYGKYSLPVTPDMGGNDQGDGYKKRSRRPFNGFNTDIDGDNRNPDKRN